MTFFNDPTLLLIVIILGVTVILLQLYIESRRKPRELPRITRTLLKCTKCGNVLEIDYEEGDFISLVKGKCSRCGAPMKIQAIYTIEVKQPK